MKILATLAALLVAVATSKPVATAPRTEAQAELDKRDTEIVYLANCKHLVSGCPSPAETDSYIFYYPASAAANSGQPFSSDNQCAVMTSSYAWWGNSSLACTFPTNGRFSAHIDADAQSGPDYSWAGWGSNGCKNWNCYKDNGRTIITTSGTEWSNSCSSVYYCTPQ
ncbi:uncharacterized protein THITE_2089046 [Thermothielavioides terrestris NRRL 8126]|uniref:Small secreted protein n=1 Tax=Thermothielavioides terrestris (strain ATCC 38088 / NRRL 8126) TaxID=578455 RepID=G2R619_THETT|nr:uncharacterized protein THITE_2089046 [Thermothielavioides terrestris NRRL 8126]AEO67556.1 hypothetical protein THITE_2089046 [Thermothielavioides terrestris NRRL 8126]